MSVNSENHVLGLWIGGGVTPAALREIDRALRFHLQEQPIRGSLRTELENVANACDAQLSKLPPPVSRYL